VAKQVFRNLDGSGAQGFAKVFRWAVLDRLAGRRVRHAPGPPAPSVEAPSEELKKVPAKTEGVRLTWLGHASWLVQLDGVSLLIDPVLGRSLSGVVRRLAPLPIGVGELPLIDATLITHSHRDHLDLPTVKRVGARVITGVGMRRHFKSMACEELEWWQSAQVGGVRVTFVPAQHWSNRGLLDINESLWGGFVVEGSGCSVYHSGDTAYFAGFKEIGRRFPRLSAALLPIGAYQPEWFMRRQHMNPQDAVQAFVDLGAEQFFAMHWGTFQLTDEPVSEPPQLLRKAWGEQRLPEEKCHVLKVGESSLFRPPRSG
jgi:L-ascorbate metabolism protein UlaG (beta-lactamase superfamily)